ncbi:hypothetical protein N8I74_04985 [Chitiniphilus purpureus]|uniref:Uncharacterized protein n=1 Tax=Chitiniphilus purpureus TaxID=2981137 RepID=A0ABY6DX01_9NEIS|nr:hypothetical protein [Chitiniphilus sp. CD1]UXY16378.1 hypothetical protein N8I74_04985 [Chitiniphilus sp. CD1]
MRMRHLSRIPLLLSLVCCALPATAAVPTHFGEQMEAALTCRSEVSAGYWQDYFRRHLGTPLRRWGEADWFDSQKAVLAGNPTHEVFAGVPESGARMVGALIPAPAETVRRNIETRLSIRFVALPGPYPRYLSAFGSVLVEQPDRQTKWYCARWHLGNRP